MIPYYVCLRSRSGRCFSSEGHRCRGKTGFLPETRVIHEREPQRHHAAVSPLQAQDIDMYAGRISLDRSNGLVRLLQVRVLLCLHSPDGQPKTRQYSDGPNGDFIIGYTSIK